MSSDNFMHVSQRGRKVISGHRLMTLEAKDNSIGFHQVTELALACQQNLQCRRRGTASSWHGTMNCLIIRVRMLMPFHCARAKLFCCALVGFIGFQCIKLLFLYVSVTLFVIKTLTFTALSDRS